MAEPLTTFVILTWVWNKFQDDVISSVKRAKKRDWESFQWEEAAENYADRIKDSCGRAFILGVGDKPLENIYTYVTVLEKLTAQQRYGQDVLEEFFLKRYISDSENESKSGLDLIQNGQDYFILGKPGAGKTTFLKSIALKAVNGELYEAKEEKRLPIFLFLREHADSGKSLFQSIEAELQICGFPDVPRFVESLLDSGRAVLLLDGLDEVKKEDDIRKNVIRDIIKLRRKYPQTQVIITCRVADTDYEFQEINHLEIADFNDGQIQVFLKNWFEEDKFSESCWEQLQKDGSSGLLELARSPLLLTLLALSYEDSGEFPPNRVEIYESAIDALLKKWDAKRTVVRDKLYKDLTPKQKQRMFAHVAYDRFLAKDFIPKQSILSNLLAGYVKQVPNTPEDPDGDEILASVAANHGIFVERSQRLWSFAHLTFHEFFTAKHIESNAKHGALEGMFEHIEDTQWREVFLMTASLLDSQDAEDFFELFYIKLNEISNGSSKLQYILKLSNQKAELVSQSLSFNITSIRLTIFKNIINLIYVTYYLTNESVPVIRYSKIGRSHYNKIERELNKCISVTDTELIKILRNELSFRFLTDKVRDKNVIYEYKIGDDLMIVNSKRRSQNDKVYIPSKFFADLFKTSNILKELSLDEASDSIEEFKSSLTEKLSFEMLMELANEVNNIGDLIFQITGVAQMDLNSEERKSVESLDLSLDHDFFESLDQYVNLHSLLVECLELATIGNRQQILSRLYL